MILCPGVTPNDGVCMAWWVCMVHSGAAASSTVAVSWSKTQTLVAGLLLAQ
jgi:hypothetical protein